MNKNFPVTDVDRNILDRRESIHFKDFNDIVKVRSLCGKEIVVTVAGKVV